MKAFADAHGEVSPSAVTKWKRGERLPRRAAMERIAEITRGAVSANDFLTTPEPSGAA